MRTDLFDFDLPDSAIALRPAAPRDSARLLVVGADAAGALQDRRVRDLPQLLRAGDCLVLNDTRVVPARLDGRRERQGVEARVSVNLLRRVDEATWSALARPARKLAPGDRVRFGAASDNACALAGLDATVTGRGEAGEVTLRFDVSGPDLDVAIAGIGSMPLPPYIAGKRAADDRDRTDYQTVFAARDGAVAAPTGGLHFTADLLGRLGAAGIGHETVTLHVGAGTFLPVKADDTAGHRMHAEWGEVTSAVAARLDAGRRAGGRIVAVGTTALRILETAAAGGRIAAFAGETDIFITPGYRFRAVDALMTNFHLPRSTLVMLVAAFAGLDAQRAAYRHAIASGYRFYSYGDSSLWFRPPDGARD